MIVEILSRLPAKSLIKFQCVSKTWKSLTSSRELVPKFMANSPYKMRHMLLVAMPHNRGRDLRFMQCVVNTLGLNHQTAEMANVDHDFPAKHDKLISFAGSCNGLICVVIGVGVRGQVEDVYLWNPCIRKSKRLPDFGYPSYTKRFGMGYSEKTGDHKVVGLAYHSTSSDALAKIYSQKTDSWEDIIIHFKERVPASSSEFLKGKLHWRGYMNIINIDVETQKVEGIALPNHGENLKWTNFAQVNGCLALFVYSTEMNIWVMTEYGVEDSWMKVFTLPETCHLRHMFKVIPIHNWEILVHRATGLSGLSIYSLENDANQEILNRRVKTFVLYTESLALPDISYGVPTGP